MHSPTVVKSRRVCLPITSVCLVQVSQDTVQAVADEVADRVHERLGLFSPTPPPGPNVVTPAPTTAAGASPPSRGSVTTHRESCLGTIGVSHFVAQLAVNVTRADRCKMLVDTKCINNATCNCRTGNVMVTAPKVASGGCSAVVSCSESAFRIPAQVLSIKLCLIYL